MNELIKSKHRVRKFGEIFTPKWIAEKMLNLNGIDSELTKLTTTFLEPSAGEGAFLIRILEAKMNVAKTISTSKTEFNENTLIGLSTIYGIELLEDNVEKLNRNMLSMFMSMYSQMLISEYNSEPDARMIENAKLIIKCNMIQGDALKKINKYNEPLVITEWKLCPIKYNVRKIQRNEYTLDDIILQNGPMKSKKMDNEIDLLSGYFNDNTDEVVTNFFKYVPVKITDIYKEEKVKI